MLKVISVMICCASVGLTFGVLKNLTKGVQETEFGYRIRDIAEYFLLCVFVAITATVAAMLKMTFWGVVSLQNIRMVITAYLTPFFLITIVAWMAGLQIDAFDKPSRLKTFGMIVLVLIFVFILINGGCQLKELIFI